MAAVIPVTFGTAHECLFEVGLLKAGETVLVQAGASGLGVATIQLAKRAGATVLATASKDDKLDRLKPYGLDFGTATITRKEDVVDVGDAAHQQARGSIVVTDPGRRIDAAVAACCRSATKAVSPWSKMPLGANPCRTTSSSLMGGNWIAHRGVSRG